MKKSSFIILSILAFILVFGLIFVVGVFSSKNTAIDYLRTLKNKAISIDDQENGIQLSNISNVADENRSLTYTNLIEMFDSLPETNKKVVKLYYESGMTVAQISKAMNVPVGTIKSYLYRTRNNLKKQLKLC